MSIATKCSHCGASYNLNDQMRGKTVRCKHCQETFVVGAAPAGRRPARDADDEQIQSGRTAPRPAGPGKKGGPGREKTSPPAAKSSTGKTLLIVGGVVGLCLLVCCGGPTAVFLYFGYWTTHEVKDFGDQIQAEMDKAAREQARMNGQGNPGAGRGNVQDPQGGGKLPASVLFGQEPKNLDEALAELRSNEAGRQGVALHWLFKQPVDKARQAEVARALESVLSSAANPVTRSQAISPLTTWGDKDSVPALAKVLNDAKPGIGFSKDAMDALARFPDRRGAEAVARYLTNFFTGDAAFASLQTMGKAVAEQAALKYYHDPDGGRERARKLLQGFGTADSAIAQQSAADLKSLQVETRRLAAEWLGQVRQPDPAVRDQVAKGLEESLTDRDNGVAERAAQALAVWAGKENVPALARLLDDQTAQGNVRHHVVLALGRIPDERAAAALVKCLNGNERGDASKALQTLGAVAERELVKYVNDPTANQDGRNEAGRILKAIGSKENVAVTVAVASLKDNDAGRRREAADALTKVPAADKAKQADVAAALEAALTDSDEGVRERAAKALVIWAVPDNVAGLVKAVGDQNRWVRVSAMMALGKLQDDRGVVPIASRLLVPEDRREASAALQALGPKAETEVLKGLQTPDKDLLLELLKILKVIGTKASVKPLKYVAQVAVQLKQRDVAEAALLALQEVGKR
jgi:predicted Zn finger-like uncharacterized protein